MWFYDVHELGIIFRKQNKHGRNQTKQIKISRENKSTKLPQHKETLSETFFFYSCSHSFDESLSSKDIY